MLNEKDQRVKKLPGDAFVAEQATQVGCERLGRTGNSALEEKAMLAARAYIRYNYTKCENRLPNFEIPLRPGAYLCREIKSEAMRQLTSS